MTHRRDSHPTVGMVILWAWENMPFRFLLAVAALLMLSVNYAAAEDDRAEIRRQLISSCKFWETCGQYFKPTYRRNYEPRRYEIERRYEPRVYGYREEYDAHDCKPMITATGDEKYGKDRAKEDAEGRWMESVKGKWGPKYMELRYSIDGTWDCGRSSTGNRASEKAAETLGKYLEQCELKARPCRRPLERVNRD